MKAGEYELLYLPDLKNDLLQREGKPPVYYWMPAGVRLARKNADTGDYKFHMIHFVGVQSGDTTVGVSGTREVAGGVHIDDHRSAAAGRTGSLAEGAGEHLPRQRRPVLALAPGRSK